MAKPKISIIMPFYNCEKYLDESIQSILDQTFSDFEFIIINDASTDNSDEVVKKYLSDKRIVYVKNKTNKGIVYNWNHGIEIAKADLVALTDGDDISDITRIEKQYKFLLKHNLDVVGTFVFLVDERKKIIRRLSKPVKNKDIKKDIFKYIPIVIGTLVGRKKVLSRLKFRQKYNYCEEMDFFFRLLYEGYQAGNINEFLYYYRQHPNNVISKHGIRRAIQIYRLRKEMLRKYKLNLSFEEYFIMYAYLVLGFFPSKFRLFCEMLYKKLFH